MSQLSHQNDDVWSYHRMTGGKKGQKLGKNTYLCLIYIYIFESMSTTQSRSPGRRLRLRKTEAQAVTRQKLSGGF